MLTEVCHTPARADNPSNILRERPGSGPGYRRNRSYRKRMHFGTKTRQHRHYRGRISRRGLRHRRCIRPGSQPGDRRIIQRRTFQNLQCLFQGTNGNGLFRRTGSDPQKRQHEDKHDIRRNAGRRQQHGNVGQGRQSVRLREESTGNNRHRTEANGCNRDFELRAIRRHDLLVQRRAFDRLYRTKQRYQPTHPVRECRGT